MYVIIWPVGISVSRNASQHLSTLGLSADDLAILGMHGDVENLKNEQKLHSTV